MNGGQCLYGKHCLFKHNENETSERNEIKNFENSEVGQKNIWFHGEKNTGTLNKLEQNKTKVESVKLEKAFDIEIRPWEIG